MEGEFWVVRTPTQKACVLDSLNRLKPSADKPMAVKVGPFKATRSTLQNRFLWGWVYSEISRQLDEAGIVIPCDDGTEHPYTKDVLHEVFKQKFLAIGSIEAKGKSIILYGSTAKLTKKKFSEYLENVRRFAFDFWGITVVDPYVGQYKAIWGELSRGRKDNKRG
ncbi:recombination protein NinB [uncultured Microbulbifer sp.]|uniref:recombination protein NinB n=1 Tax=uncultured Microbulbifer sp. TaxID=348147 RepID=UPI0026283B48|nr:recombination protein NinB [uncultured Microbulbifer sp.]